MRCTDIGGMVVTRNIPLVENRGDCSVTAPKGATIRSPGVRREQGVECLIYMTNTVYLTSMCWSSGCGGHLHSVQGHADCAGHANVVGYALATPI